MGIGLAALVAGCSGADRRAARQKTFDETFQLDSTPAPHGVELVVDTPDTIAAGEMVSIAATLANRGRDTVRLVVHAKPGNPPMVVEVALPDGTPVWHQAAGDSASAPTTLVLRPGEIVGSGIAWEQRDEFGDAVKPGPYQVRAVLHQSPHDVVSAWRPFIVRPH
jgi:hypothetical protein